MPQSPKDDPTRRTLAEIPAAEPEPIRPPPVAADRPAPAPPAKAAPSAAPSPAPDKTETVPFRPTRRPPMALLEVLDDAGKNGEVVRIRASRFVIGRAEGDLVIPHDPQISSKHAEIVRVLQQGQHHWHLRDLSSTNGTFVRTKSAVLKDGTEILIARQRFRFVAEPPAEQGARPEQPLSGAAIGRTLTFGLADLAMVPPDRPHLLELLPRGEGRRLPLASDEQWLGRDARQCALSFPDEPTVNPRHARVYRDGQGRWHIEDLGSLNGVWVRVTEVPLSSQAFFLLGDQVFAITFP